jgi:hypothetical protein
VREEVGLPAIDLNHDFREQEDVASINSTRSGMLLNVILHLEAAIARSG